ncbi:MAG: hypothetical protein WAM60_23140 [Candidatus Promineifilaceae bacterium]
MTTHTVSLPAAESRKRPHRFLRAMLVNLAGVIVITLLYLTLVWPWMSTWGATKEEQEKALPGDELVPAAMIQTTKGITIQAGPEAIYPWLLQIGVDRGGMYSYDRLENLFGLNVHTVDTIVPEYQQAAVGDFWRFTPKDYVLNPGPGLWVKALKENSAVLLCFGMENKPDDACIDTWQFVLEPQADSSTRLLLRSRMAIEPQLPIKLTYPVQFIMERKMLLEIRERVETYSNN